MDTTVYKGETLKKDSVLDLRTQFKPSETFQYTQFTSCHPPGVKRGFLKGGTLRLLTTNSLKELFEQKIKTFKEKHLDRGYPESFNTENTFKS